MPPPTTPAQNVALMRNRYITSIQQNNNLTLIDSVFHKDFFDHTAAPLGSGQGRDYVRAIIHHLHSALQDIRIEVAHCICENNVVATTKMLRGKQIGELFGNQPKTTEGWIEFMVRDFMTVVDGELREHWATIGGVESIQHVPGLLPPPSSPKTSTAASATASENVALMRKYIMDVQQGGDLALIDLLFHEDFLDYTAHPGVLPGRGDVHAILGHLHAAVKDIRFEIIHCICQDEVVATTKVLRGKQVGVLFDRPVAETGSGRIEIMTMDFVRVVEGRMREWWATVGDVRDV
ncbi:hypothetical protein LTR56_002352 [Elasticomyces elasticus]|nr:hypothetical protein LTR56_002352 [Elasticomyces elasticus]KAK3665916.1 hypothetical protein LTR22_003235 [Elasticomyces elasticus]KAK4929388.1 hypothetical protein LTR49_003992 [Elasticomyces elasticus]KAK5764677.1 hypothetical protein LTS12_005178 [Elasticomyces elasticus]